MNFYAHKWVYSLLLVNQYDVNMFMYLSMRESLLCEMPPGYVMPSRHGLPVVTGFACCEELVTVGSDPELHGFPLPTTLLIFYYFNNEGDPDLFC